MIPTKESKCQRIRVTKTSTAISPSQPQSSIFRAKKNPSSTDKDNHNINVTIPSFSLSETNENQQQQEQTIAINPFYTRRYIRKVSTIDEVQVQSGIFGTSSNLVNAILGAGLIGIPYAMAQTGIILGIILLLLVSYFTDKSLRMIVELASFHPKLKDLGVLTFEDLMSIPYGRLGSNFILLSMLLLAYGKMLAYLLIVKDTVPTILGLGASFLEREVVMLGTSACIMVPLSLFRDMSQLAATSFFSVTASLGLVVIVVMDSPVSATVQNYGGIRTVIRGFGFQSGCFIGLGILSIAMACQHSAFLISGSLQHHTPARWAAVTGGSVTVASSLSLLLGVFGFLGFLAETEGDVLNNFDSGSTTANGARALLAIIMFFTYPMDSFVARHVVVKLFCNGSLDNLLVGPTGELLPERKFLGLIGRCELITLVLYAMALAPALIMDDLGPVLSLAGSLGASGIAYIAPGLAYLGVNGGDFLERIMRFVRSPHSSRSSNKISSLALPVVSDSTANMDSLQENHACVLLKGLKPWWWYPTGG
jgi:sodium-coupled neutral amino acid transporter 11